MGAAPHPTPHNYPSYASLPTPLLSDQPAHRQNQGTKKGPARRLTRSVASCDSLAIGGFLGCVGVGLGCPFGDKLDKAETLRLGERFKRGQLVGNRYRLFAGGRE